MPPTFDDHSQGSFDSKPSAKIVNAENVAVTARFADRMRSQSPLPEQEPLQPVKDEPAVGVAVSVTAVPSA